MHSFSKKVQHSFLGYSIWKKNCLFVSTAYWLCYLNSTINPFLYALCNANFRQTFKRILTCKWSTRPRYRGLGGAMAAHALPGLNQLPPLRWSNRNFIHSFGCLSPSPSSYPFFRLFIWSGDISYSKSHSISNNLFVVLFFLRNRFAFLCFLFWLGP